MKLRDRENERFIRPLSLYEGTAACVLPHGISMLLGFIRFLDERARLSPFLFFHAFERERVEVENHKLQAVIWLCCLRVRKSISMHVRVDEGRVPTLSSLDVYFTSHVRTYVQNAGGKLNSLLRGALLWRTMIAFFVDLAAFGEMYSQSKMCQNVSIIVPATNLKFYYRHIFY